MCGHFAGQPPHNFSLQIQVDLGVRAAANVHHYAAQSLVQWDGGGAEPSDAGALAEGAVEGLI